MRSGGRASVLATVALVWPVVIAGCTSAPPSGNAAGSSTHVTAEAIASTTVPSETDQMLHLARSFVFRVRNEACLATGTAFATSGTIVTNRHVAAGASQVDLATWQGSDFSAQVGALDRQADLAQLQAAPPPAVAAPLARADPADGDPVWVAGYPLGNQLTVTTGRIVASLPGSEFGTSSAVLEISDRVQPGNSGSPLLDSAGQVVGVVFALSRANGDGLAVPVGTLSGLLNGSSGAFDLPCAG